MASFEIVGPSLGSSKEHTYNNRCIVSNGSLRNAKTKSKLELKKQKAEVNTVNWY